MSFNDRIHQNARLTTERPKPYATEQYEKIIQAWIENRDNADFINALPPNLILRIERYLDLKGDDPYPDLHAWIGENRWFMDHFTNVRLDRSFSSAFSNSFD